MTLEDKGYWVALSMAPGIGPKRFQKIIHFFGSAEAGWKGSIQAWEKVLGPKAAAGFHEFRKRVEPVGILERLDRKAIKFVLSCDGEFPQLLSQIYDPPPVLYYKGQFTHDDTVSVAVVGSRSASPSGLLIAEDLARGLAEAGVTVVSGLARGIDSAAHRGALQASAGRTIAVLGSGVDRIYPPENKKLADEIICKGALCSEFPPGTSPLAQNFPARNRIISGLSLGVTVVEATEDSGSLITVDFALEQGRDVFAVPGAINKRRSKGTNRLIKEGALLVEGVEDILEALGSVPACERTGRSAALPEQAEESGEDIDSFLQKKILAILSEEEYHLDVLVRLTGYSPADVGAALALLELKKLVSQIAPGVYCKCK